MNKELTIAEIAESKGRDPSTVLRWIHRGLFPNANLRKTPLGEYWVIPEFDLNEFKDPKPGPKLKTDRRQAA